MNVLLVPYSEKLLQHFNQHFCLHFLQIETKLETSRRNNRRGVKREIKISQTKYNSRVKLLNDAFRHSRSSNSYRFYFVTIFPCLCYWSRSTLKYSTFKCYYFGIGSYFSFFAAGNQ